MQQADDIMDLWLTEETLRYPFRFMALKEIMSNPYKYGFIIKSHQLYKPIKTEDLVVNYQIDDLASFAKKHGITYSQLKEFNSWLRDRNLPNKSGKKYTIKIPTKEDLYYNNTETSVYNKNWVVD